MRGRGHGVASALAAATTTAIIVRLRFDIPVCPKQPARRPHLADRTVLRGLN